MKLICDIWYNLYTMNNDPHKIKAVLFDVDGTLIDAFDCHFYGQNTALKEVFGVTGCSDLSFSGHLLPEGLQKIALKQGAEPQRVAENIEAALQMWSDKTIEKLNNGGKCIVLPGVVELLESLTSRGILLGIITGSTREMAKALLEKPDLLKYFRFLATGEEAEDRPHLAEVALERLRRIDPSITHQNVTIVGDSPNDIRAGKAINAHSVAVATGVHSVELLETEKPDRLLLDFSDLTSTLDSILKKV
jgi:phosphoglycolate phosphatase